MLIETVHSTRSERFLCPDRAHRPQRSWPSADDKSHRELFSGLLIFKLVRFSKILFRQKKLSFSLVD